MGARRFYSPLSLAMVGLAALAVGVLLGTVIDWPAESPKPEPIPVSDPVLLKELAERFIAAPELFPAGRPNTARLVPGALPPGLPFQVPLPEGARLLGSLVLDNGPSGESWVILLDTPGSAADALDFYQDALMALGWTPPPVGPGAQGFRPTLPPAGASFCRGPGGPWLRLNAATRAQGTAEVRLNISQNPGPCSQTPGPSKPIPPGLDRLPVLYGPKGALLDGVSTSSGGPNRWNSDATAETDLSPADLEAHFAAQLKAAGWTRLGGLTQGPVAWSLWSLPSDGNWQGLLYVAEGPTRGRRWLHLRVEAGR